MKINKPLSQTILSSLALLFFTTGCVPKNQDGTYSTIYSYHPYNHVKAQKKIYYGNKVKIYNPTLKRYRAYKQSPKQFKRSHQPNPFKSKDFLSRKNSSKFLPDRIEKSAKLRLGTPYHYGATGPQSYDCSGFVKSVYASQGIKLPRTSKAQSKVGKYLRFSELKKGDLTFFKSNDHSKVSHVGIYLGKGKFIHASSSKRKVVISNMNSDYAITNFVWGRRLGDKSHFAKR